MDPKIKLRSVNGGIIPTFGTEELVIRLGRKPYKITAIKADVPQRILGWNFFRTHKLGLEWGEFGDLFITDKKAQTRSLVKYETVNNKVNSVDSYEEPEMNEVSAQSLLYQMDCMNKVETWAQVTNADQVNAMTIHPDNPSPVAEDIPLPGVDSDPHEVFNANIQPLKKVKEPFAALIGEHPGILQANFKKKQLKTSIIG